MHKLYSPETELDLAFIKSLLESENIEFYVHNEHYGSMILGPKIDLLNAKTMYVHDKDAEKAQEIVDDYLAVQDEEEEVAEPRTYTFLTKLRIIAEALIFSWFIPQGRRWKKELGNEQCKDN